jgi:hypothetical protein
MKTINLKTIIIIAILVVFSQAANAQYKSIVLGVKVAPNLGWLKTDQEGYESQGAVAGLGWGLIADFYFAENYAFGTGFSFDWQNGKLSYPEQQGSDVGVLTRNYRLKYLELPAVIKMKTNEMKGFRFYGQIGLGLGIRLSSKGKDVFASPGNPDQTTDFRLIDSQTTLFKGSLIVGAGIEYPLDNSTSLVAGINFNNGFTNALKGNNTVNPDVKHQGIPNMLELSLAVMF